MLHDSDNYFEHVYSELQYCHSPSLSLLLLDSAASRDIAWTGLMSLVLESLFRKVGGPVGVRAGFCIGGGLADGG